MRGIFMVILCLIAQASFCQNVFSFAENGLTPKEVNHSLSDEQSKALLFKKTMGWIQKNEKSSKLVVIDQVENEYITISLVKPNYINVKKDYYYVKYIAKISFSFGQYKFEPLEVFTKLNSKYDMGWQPFDLNDGASFFKRGKPVKRTKVYVQKIPAVFNTLNDSLNKELNPS